MLGQATLSDSLGVLSIITWLGAQSPQIYENYKNGSVEGLALPFLISWFWGDFTNFVGCVLTHQLPFQTYLATYFLLVDVALVSQYYYYSRRKPPHDLPPLSESFPYAQGSGPHHPPYVHPRKASRSRRRSSRNGVRRSNSYAHPSHQQQHHHASPSNYSSRDPLMQSFMSEMSTSSTTHSAANHKHGGHQTPSSSQNRQQSRDQPQNFRSSRSVSSSSLYEPPSPASPFVTEQQRGRTLTRHSSASSGSGIAGANTHGGFGGGGGGGGITSFSHHAFDPTLSTIYGSPSVTGAGAGGEYLNNTEPNRLPSLHGPHQYHQHHQHVSFDPTPTSSASVSVSGRRDREYRDNYDTEPESESEREGRAWAHTHELNRTSSSRSRPPPPSRRGTGIAFLSVGLLFTIGSRFNGDLTTSAESSLWPGGRTGAVVKPRGDAWSTSKQLDTGWQVVPARAEKMDRWDGLLDHIKHIRRYPALTASPTVVRISFEPLPPTSRKRAVYPLDVSTSPPASASTSISLDNVDRGRPLTDNDPAPEGPDWERVIGRISAWLCTTLYLTSRLPQIWRNFRRRSVEGLAMTLFFFAFIGNSLYVASILTNPLATTEPGYLIESTPYLLGSGGTLCFDLMILTQSWIYSDKRRKRSTSNTTATGGGKRFLSPEEEEGLLESSRDTGTEIEEGTGQSSRDHGSSVTRQGGGRGSGTRSRDSSVRSFDGGRSISSRRSRGGENDHATLSLVRSRSIEVAPSGRGGSSIVEIDGFDWEESERSQGTGASRRMTPSRVNSNRSSLISSSKDVIPEAGESAFTFRT